MKPTIIICIAASALFGLLGYYCTLHAKPHRVYHETSYTTQQVQVMHDLVARSVAESNVAPDRCGLDWACLLQWSNEEHPRKGKHHG